VLNLIRSLSRAVRRLGVLALLSAGLAPGFAQRVQIIEQNLPNGFRVLMVERHDDPTISGGWVAHVGSANERPGITGIAHLFEHMMFKGTPTIGTKDYKKDLAIMPAGKGPRRTARKSQNARRLSTARSTILKPENKTRAEELERNSTTSSSNSAPSCEEQFDRVYAIGGVRDERVHFTDLTGYFITVPANKLELWMWMESERICRPVFREFYAG
jgi:predicted Zn-dependent peptidase